MTFNQIIADIKRKVYYPIYLLHGEEEYFIDKISDLLEASILDESEKEFNQTILYGKEIDEQTIVAEAKRYPMMANHNVVIVKEAQNIKSFDALDAYAKQPLESTVLVFCYKYKKFDGRKAFSKIAAKIGVAFESKPIYDNEVEGWIDGYVKSKGYTINASAKRLIAESIGTNLSRLSNELNKVMIVEEQGATIDESIVQKNIGISKDYNVFELNKAIGSRDILKCNKIINYFIANPKASPFVLMSSMLYRNFTLVIKYHYLENKSERAVASALKINPFFVKDTVQAANNFSIRQLVKAIDCLHDADLKRKGVGAYGMSEGEILREMIFKILH
jgi:DNA polymerase-3 subunit delta